MGFVMMSPGRESDLVKLSHHEKLCGTDILGLEENQYNHDEFVF